jgi:large subunit ribosomal protein L21e
MPHSKGFRHSTRKVFKKSSRDRGLQPLGKMLKKYDVGERVLIKVDPAIHKGMPHRRYHGKSGVVAEVRGRAYVVNIKTGNMTKKIITRPEHLQSISGQKK